MVDYTTALKTYFKLKTKYEKKYSSKKAKILNNAELSKKEKMKKIKNLKMNCINCKRPVGTIFKDENRQYICICGSTDSPCELKIILQKSQTYNLLNLKEDTNKMLQQNINDLLKTKLDLIFGFIDEITLEDTYSDQKEAYDSNLNQLNLIKDNIEDQTNMNERNKNVHDLNIELYETVQQLKSTMATYMETKNPGLLKDAMEQYTDIYEKTELLRNNKYRMIFMEHEDNEPTNPLYLKTKVNAIQDYEIELVNPDVIEFNV
jgi:hypothetical protein